MPVARSLVLRLLQPQIVVATVLYALLRIGVHSPTLSRAAPVQAVAIVRRAALPSQIDAATYTTAAVQHELESLDAEHPHGRQRQHARDDAQKQAERYDVFFFLRSHRAVAGAGRHGSGFPLPRCVG